MNKQQYNKYPLWFQIYSFFKGLGHLPFWQDRINKYFLFGAIITNIALWIYIKLKIEVNPFFIILRYRVYEGPELIGKPEDVYNIVFTGVIIFFINASLSYFLMKKDRYLARLSLLTGLIFQFILFGTVITIVKNLP